MAIERVRAYLEQYGAAGRVLEFGVSSATVELAAKALGCEPGRIAKSLSFGVGEGYIVIVTAGDCKIDNAKYKAKFHAKARMLTPPEVEEHIGHAVGGVCPFGVNDGVAVYLDESLRRFGTVFPACGAATAPSNSPSRSWNAIPGVRSGWMSAKGSDNSASNVPAAFRLRRSGDVAMWRCSARGIAAVPTGVSIRLLWRTVPGARLHSGRAFRSPPLPSRRTPPPVRRTLRTARTWP